MGALNMIDRIPISGNHYIWQDIKEGFATMTETKSAKIYLGFLILVLLLGIIGPLIAPYGPQERVRGDDGDLMRSEPPSLEHPLGTTETATDVLSRLLIGARPTAVTGLLGGFIIISIGATVGITAGYMGGWVDNILMRLTDLVYGIPLLIFAMVLLAFFGLGFFSSIVVIGMILWRGSARAIRSQVLQIKERAFIKSARATGASTPRIMVKNILPNVAPMAVLFMAIGIGGTILIQAGLAFIGVVDPFVPSWGIMIRNVQTAGLVGDNWWWSLPPSFMLAATVTCTFMFGREYEKLATGEQTFAETEE